MPHLGDPCIHCSSPHDAVDVGPCKKSTGLAATARSIYFLTHALEEHDKVAALTSAALKKQIAEHRTVIAQSEAGLDLDQIALAETVVAVSDYSKGGDERNSARQDAIKWFATGKNTNGGYGNLRREYFGTKRYDRWNGQRCDCEYGMAPRHGIICFRIALVGDRERELSDAEREAAVYYLVNLERIQAAKGTA